MIEREITVHDAWKIIIMLNAWEMNHRADGTEQKR